MKIKILQKVMLGGNNPRTFEIGEIVESPGDVPLPIALEWAAGGYAEIVDEPELSQAKSGKARRGGGENK